MRQIPIYWRWRLIASCSLMLAGTMAETGVAEEPLTEPPLPVVTNVLQFHRLADRAAHAVCALRLEGVVRWASPIKGLMVLQDDSGAALVETDPQNQPVQPGQTIVLEGICSGAGSGESLRIGRCLLVDNDGIHETGEKSGTVFLKAGKHPFCVSWFDGKRPFGLEVYYQGPNLPRQRIPDPALSRVVVNPASGAATWVQGVDYQAYEGQWLLLPDFHQLTAARTGATSNFVLKVNTRDRNVGIEFTGYVEVPSDGLYTFSTVSAGGSQLFVELPHPRVVGTAPLPPPRRVILGQIRSQGEESLWEEVDGRVTFVSNEGSGRLKLELSSETGRMRVEIADASGASSALLLNSLIRVTGICRSTYTLDEHKIPGALWVPGLEQMELLEVAPKLWTDMPIVPIGDLLATNFSEPAEPMIHVSGRVRSVGPGQLLMIEDETGRVALQTKQPLPKLGDRIEALAKPRQTGTNFVLQHGYFRQVESVKGEAGSLPVLTTIEQIKRLKYDEAQRGYPVKIRGVIIWSRKTAVIIQDSTQAIYVDEVAATEPDPFRVGELWEIEGVTVGRFSPVVLARRVVRLGMGTLPEPAHPVWDQLLNASLDSRYAEVQGIVLAVRARNLTLLTREGKKLQVRLTDMPLERIEAHEGALVRVRGPLSAIKDPITLSFKIGEIQIRNASINVDQPAPVDPFTAPAKHAKELLLFDSQASPFQQVKVAGQVVHARAGEYYLMDGTNGLRFIPKAALQLQPGDQVEAVGFPELEGPSPVLREAVTRQIGKASLPQARRLTQENLLSAEHDSTFVMVQAELINLSHDRKDQVLGLQMGPHLFVARLDHEAKPAPSLLVGSRLELTGVYAGRGGDRTAGQAIDSFELLLNSPSDIRVLTRPSWWTLNRLLAVVGVLAGVMMAALVWISLLRRQVEQRTVQLRKEIHEREQAEHLRAVEAERSRIARDLHDDLGSSLTEISLLADAGPGSPPTLDKAGGRFSLIAEKARSIVNSLDVIVWLVNPRKDALPFLAGYVGSYAEEFLSASGIACRLKIPRDIPPLPLTAEVRHSLFLAVKETLNNAVRHAHASKVVMELAVRERELEITITDNGRGFDPSTPVEGNGIENLRDRLARVGGQCRINSQQGIGTMTSLILPLPANSNLK
jgi:signal transduction histidine kinase